MRFLHEDPDFEALIRLVADRSGLASGLVEKDYWVTHTLWALHDQGFEVWFKGGTSLSKGFGLIHRFSEDLDLKLEPGSSGIPGVTNWKSDGRRATEQRRSYFAALIAKIAVPGAAPVGDLAFGEPTHRSCRLLVRYPGHHLATLGPLAPYVVLEVGHARVTPHVVCSMTSYVHEELRHQGQEAAFLPNRPDAVRCVHPVVTLLEKLDAIQRRFPRPEVPATTFVRHYEDAARVIEAAKTLPALDGYADTRTLANDMVELRQIAALPDPGCEAFAPLAGARAEELRRAYDAIAPMYWGPRQTLNEACRLIREWSEAHVRQHGISAILDRLGAPTSSPERDR